LSLSQLVEMMSLFDDQTIISREINELIINNSRINIEYIKSALAFLCGRENA